MEAFQAGRTWMGACEMVAEQAWEDGEGKRASWELELAAAEASWAAWEGGRGGKGAGGRQEEGRGAAGQTGLEEVAADEGRAL